MLITFNYQITLMEMKTENRDKIMSHDKPVTAAIYNSVFNQVSKQTTTENHNKIMSHDKLVSGLYATLCLIRSIKKPPQKTMTRSCHMKSQSPRLYTTLPLNYYHYGYEYSINQGSKFLLMPKIYFKFCTVNLCIDTMYFVCLIQT